MEIYKTQQLENEKMTLVADLDVSTTTVLKQKKTILIIAAFSILLLGLIALIAYLFRQQKQLNTQMQEKNNQIELLNKEINHRVKNNLAFVSSLLEMQARRLDNDDAKKYLLDTETRIKAVAAANQQIYNTGKDSSTIHLKNYLEDLAHHLKSIYDTDEKPITFQLDISQTSVQAEDAMRIGLVMNELMTNSIKHAFKDISHPLIGIRSSSDSEGKTIFCYNDNGTNFDAINLPSPSLNKNSMGLKIIQLLQNQLKHDYQFVVSA